MLRHLFRFGIFCLLAWSAPRSVRADAAADALFQKCARAEGAAFTHIATGKVWHTDHGVTKISSYTVTLCKPNRARYDFGDPKRPRELLTLFSNGKRILLYSQGAELSAALPVDPKGILITTVTLPLGGAVDICFFSSAALRRLQKPGSERKIVGSVVVDGFRCNVLQVQTGEDFYKIYIGQNGLVHGGVYVVKNAQIETRLIHQKTNVAPTNNFFGWQPPRGTRQLPLNDFFAQVKASVRPSQK